LVSDQTRVLKHVYEIELLGITIHTEVPR